ncbi:MAG: FadR family transcriptional regulator [Anaerolineaceae bacterium]|nr:FadR family transcriptional regulator [Anaerolineaceae bacterium]
MIQLPVQQIQLPSLKEACVQQLETLILSGELRMGERLPPERDLAAQLNISRPILHDALVDLETKGLLEIIPRRGTYVSDYRRNGSLAILSSLLNYHDGSLNQELMGSMLEMRLLIESETGRLAAVNRTEEQLKEFQIILDDEKSTPCNEVQTLTNLDFAFHHLIAIASGNQIYPLILNSFRTVYTSITGDFFSKYYDTSVIRTVHQFHQNIIEAIQRQDVEGTHQLMIKMLNHGETYLKGDVS